MPYYPQDNSHRSGTQPILHQDPKKTIDCSGGFTTGKGNSAADSSLAQAVRVKIESPGDPGSQLKGGGGAGGGKGDAGDCLDFGPLG